MMLSREVGQCTDFEQMSVRRIDRFGNMMKRLDTRIQSSSAWHPTSSQLPFSSCQPSTIHGVVLCVFRSWGRMSKIRAPLAPATFPHLLPTQPWVSSKDGAHGDKSWSTPVLSADTTSVDSSLELDQVLGPPAASSTASAIRSSWPRVGVGEGSKMGPHPICSDCFKHGDA